MGRRRRSKSKKHRPPDPVAVLEGRIEVRPEELFDLIHHVNPTGRELPRGEKTRRYALKNRLQSLLIHRFGERHVVVKPSEHDGVVSLAHRSGARDACHAVLSELDVDSRSWIQRRLDIEASPDFNDLEPTLGTAQASIAAGSAATEDSAAGAVESPAVRPESAQGLRL